MQAEARELARFEPYAELSAELNLRARQMANVFDSQIDALEGFVTGLSRVCALLPLDASVLAHAAYRAHYGLQLPDAIVLASVVLDREGGSDAEEALFVSQNGKDFEQPSIAALLQELHCKYLADFANAVRYIERPSE